MVTASLSLLATGIVGCGSAGSKATRWRLLAPKSRQNAAFFLEMRQNRGIAGEDSMCRIRGAASKAPGDDRDAQANSLR
jgi:hypothetical protein